MWKIVIAMVIVGGCGKAEDVKPKGFTPAKSRTIYVTGDEGILFTGSVGPLGSSASVSGMTPKEFGFDDGDILSGSFKKIGKSSKTLRVECYFNSLEVKKTAETKEESGVASVACSSSD